MELWVQLEVIKWIDLNIILAREYINFLIIMTEEKLNKGAELIKSIKYLIEQKEKWEKAAAIHKIELSTTIIYCRQSEYIDVDYSFVNFEDIKLLALARIQKHIDQLQKEFDAL